MRLGFKVDGWSLPGAPACSTLLTVIGSQWNCYGRGKCDFFTMLMMERCYFHYVNGLWGKVWVSFSSLLEPASLGQSVTYILISCPVRTAYMAFVEYKQASR